MGNPAVIMPLLNQFQSKEERLRNIEAVRECLEERFQKRGLVHRDVYWRNVGYFKNNGNIIVVMLDVNACRVDNFKHGDDDKWVFFSIDHLKNRADTEPFGDVTNNELITV
jgi:hypothetical protein